MRADRDRDRVVRYGVRAVAVAALAVAAAFVCRAQANRTGASQRPSAVATSSTPGTPTQAAKAGSSGLNNGIHVHGHWTIVVRNPDGSVASRHEFENSLQFDGIDLLPALLGGYATPGSWGVMLGSDDANNTVGPCNPSTVVGIVAANGSRLLYDNPCYIVQSGRYYGGNVDCSEIGVNFGCNGGLSVTLVNTGTVAGTNGNIPLIALQLTGTAKVTLPSGQGNIDEVGTNLDLCSAATNGSGSAAAFPPTTQLTSASTVPSSVCDYQQSGGNLLNVNNSNDWNFTFFNLPSPGITVVPNQTVEVTVLISFS